MRRRISSSAAAPSPPLFDGRGTRGVIAHTHTPSRVFSAPRMGRTGASAVFPAVVISSAAFNGPLGIAFDSAGNLWVANNGGVPGANGAMSASGTTIVEFMAAHLSTPPATGMLTPYLMPALGLSDDGHKPINGPWAL